MKKHLINIGPRHPTELFLTRLRAFVSLTEQDAKGWGAARLKIEDDAGKQIGYVTIRWKNPVEMKLPEVGRYFVADGTLESIRIDDHHREPHSDALLIKWILAAIRRRGWKFKRYDPDLSGYDVQKHLKAWIMDQVQQEK